MATTPIPNLPAAITIDGDEEIPAVKDGVAVRLTSAQIASLGGGGGGGDHLNVGITSIGLGTNGAFLYDNAGVLGNKAPTVNVNDGVHTVSAATQITFTGATVGGSNPNATVTISPSSSGLTVGTTTIASGTNGQVLYNNAGVLGNQAIPTPTIDITDGTHTVSAASTVTFTGATVSGSNPNATVTISGGGGGTSGSFQNIAEVQAATIPASFEIIECLAYANPGDLHGYVIRFIRVASQPTFPGFVRSTDRFLPNGSTDATNGGYWQIDNDIIVPQMFGVTGGYNTQTLSGPDDYAAFANMIAYTDGFATRFANFQPPISSKKVIVPLLPPNFVYYCSATLQFNLAGVSWEGISLSVDGVAGAVIWNPANVTGLLVGEQTSGCSFTNLAFQGNGGTTGSAHGLHTRRTTNFTNVNADGYSGCGFYLNGASDGAGPDGIGFNDLSHLLNCTASNNIQCGFYSFGADANVMTYDQCSSIQNGQAGFRSDGFLGNVYIDCHTSVNGSRVAGGSLVSHGGFTYAAVPVYEQLVLTLPSTTVPGTNENVWAKVANNTTDYSFTSPWVNGTVYVAGAGYCMFDGSPMYGCYSEADQGPDYGGTKVDGFNHQKTIQSSVGPRKMLTPGIFFDIDAPFGVAGAYEDLIVTLAPQNGYSGNNFAPNSAFFRVDGNITGQGFFFGLDNSLGTINCFQQNQPTPFWEGLGPNSVYTYGTTGAVHAGVCNINILGLGANLSAIGNGIIIQTANTAPGAGNAGRGWIVFNNSPSPGGPFAFQCTTAGVSGSTAVWTPLTAPVPPCTVAQLPAAGTAGRRGFVTDANSTTFNATAAGSGSNAVPVFDTGAAWHIG